MEAKEQKGVRYAKEQEGKRVDRKRRRKKSGERQEEKENEVSRGGKGETCDKIEGI